jgi:thioredoxin reductase
MAEYDVIVVGGGPAGLAATLYTLQAQLRVAMIAPTMGGKVSYPFQLRGLPPVESVWGTNLVQQFEAHIEAKLSSYFPQAVTQIAQRSGGGFQLTLNDTSIHGASAVILCTGARPQRLYVQGETEWQERGVSFSAISHAHYFRGRSVAVVGGERGLAAVLKLAALAQRVYYVLAQSNALRSSQLSETLLHNAKVQLYYGWEVQRIVGDEYVTGLDLVSSAGQTRTLAVEGVFVELGLLPNSQLVREWAPLNDDGHVIINHRCETSVPGLFAAGDVTNVYAEQVPVSIGEGVKAALSAWSYLASSAAGHR